MGNARRPLMHLALAVVTLIFVTPVLWLLVLAIRPSEITANEPLNFLFAPDFGSFFYVFTRGNAASSLTASVIQALGATTIAMPLAILASYGLTRWRYRGQKYLSSWYLGLMLAPPMIFVIPLFVVLSNMGLNGTHLAPIIAFQTFSIPLGVMLLRSFFEELPLELEEAAMVDGAGRMRILLQIILPVLRPGLLVTGIFVFCFCWNNLLFVMPLTSGETVPLTVRALSFYATSGINWTYIGATAVASMLVPMFLFFLFRKHIVSGLTFGAVK